MPPSIKVKARQLMLLALDLAITDLDIYTEEDLETVLTNRGLHHFTCEELAEKMEELKAVISGYKHLMAPELAEFQRPDPNEEELEEELEYWTDPEFWNPPL